MKKLFTFITKGESHHLLRKISKIFKIFYIVLASFTALGFIISGFNSDFDESIFFIILLAGAAFFVILFIGLVVETLLIVFSNIGENHYEELVLKKKVNEYDELSPKNKQIYDTIRNLSELRNTGAITEEDYEQKKKEFLDKLS